jgi:hypothetical protein
MAALFHAPYDHSIIPTSDNTHDLGSDSLRFRSVHIGPGTLFIQDQNNAGLNAELTVVDGVLEINGANQIQVGNVSFNDGTVQTTAVTKYCGSFYSTQTQVVTANRDGSNYPVAPINPQRTAMTLNQTDAAATNGVSIVSNSRITFAHEGTYNIAFSGQFRNFYAGGAQNSNMAIWLAKNGQDVPWSATWTYYDKYDKKQAEAWNFFIDVEAGDYCELMWWDKDGNTEMLAEAAQTTPVAIPAVPSLIVTVNQVK